MTTKIERPITAARGLSVTVWPGTLATVRDCRGALERINPTDVQVHANPTVLRKEATKAVEEVRKIVPDARVWIAVAADAGHTAARAGKLSPEALFKRRLDCAALAVSLGATGIVWNAEGWWKRSIPGFEGPDADLLTEETRKRYPQLVQGLTSYFAPTLHRSFPWSSWKVDLHFPQVYWWDTKSKLMPRGVAMHTYRWHESEWGKAEARGLVVKAPRVGYLQAHHSTVADICEVADEFDGVAFWALPTRCDEFGIQAAQVISRLERLGFTGRGRVVNFQKAAGLNPDGRVGPRTLEALQSYRAG